MLFLCFSFFWTPTTALVLWILFLDAFSTDPAAFGLRTLLTRLTRLVYKDLINNPFDIFQDIMASCVSCLGNIDINDHTYLIMDLGIELFSLLPERVQLELSETSALCSICFEELLQRLVSSSQPRRFSSHDINTCFSCHSSLLRRRAVVLREGAVRNEIARTINSEIPLNVRVCHACWLRTSRLLQRQTQQNASRNTDNNVNVEPVLTAVVERCLICDVSLLHRRTRMIPEGPERSFISSRIHPRLIPDNARVCYACWIATIRGMQREGRPSTSLADTTNTPEHVASPPQLQQPQQNQSIILDNTRRVPNTSARCFVPRCENNERQHVPQYLRRRLLMGYNIYIPKNARVCQEHGTVYNWEFLEQEDLLNNFTKTDIEDIITICKKTHNVYIDFENIQNLEPQQCQFWLGRSADEFLQIVTESAMNFPNARLALGLFLMKLRTGEPIRRIASLMQMAPSRVCNLIAKARAKLKANFIPQHLGLQHLPRNALLRRNLTIPEGLFGQENRKAIAICDGTYIYVQKSSNYSFQKKTYSLHKYRNLVKPFLLVATDGYIIDVFGPYGATVSDSDIMNALFQDESHPLRSYFERGDVLILDRGFRDSLPLLSSLGFDIFKPESLSPGETQLATLAANKSRCVTLCRWVVEVVNGRFKRDYKIFRSEFINLASTHLMIDFKIAAALINAFHRIIQDRPDAVLILNKALERLYLPNYLADFVITNNFNRRRANFRNIDGLHEDLELFPQMAMQDLILFSLGTYQIKQARSYYGEHIKEHGTFVVEVADVEHETVCIPERVEGLLIRGRIKSRHHSGKIYYTYLLLGEGEGMESIKGYYCSCICGKRTVGCCAHTMTLVWYLGWARHQESIEAPASFLDNILDNDVEEDE